MENEIDVMVRRLLDLADRATAVQPAFAVGGDITAREMANEIRMIIAEEYGEVR